jgi:hypothetical protein
MMRKLNLSSGTQVSQLSEDDKKILEFDILAMVVDTSSTGVRGRGNAFAHEATLEERADAVVIPCYLGSPRH